MRLALAESAPEWLRLTLAEAAIELLLLIIEL